MAKLLTLVRNKDGKWRKCEDDRPGGGGPAPLFLSPEEDRHPITKGMGTKRLAGTWRSASPAHTGILANSTDGIFSTAWVALVRVDPQRKAGTVLIWNNKWGIDNTFNKDKVVELYYASAKVNADVQALFDAAACQTDGGVPADPGGHGACKAFKLANLFRYELHPADVCCRCPGQLHMTAFPARFCRGNTPGEDSAEVPRI